MQRTKVLIVDDSAFMRLTLGRRLGAEPDIEIIGTARDGAEAIAQVKTLRPDVVTMDVEMPTMNGLETLAQIMAEQPTPVIMVSSLTKEGTTTTVRALTLGAVDFIAKPSQVADMQQTVQELAGKIRQAANSRVRRSIPAIGKPPASRPGKSEVRTLSQTDTIVAIGSSTGGPGALRRLMSELAGNLDAAIVIVQHMPVGFTRSLAERLDEFSAWNVREASPGDRLLVGQALLAPGGHHLAFNRRGEVVLTSDPPVNNVRPAVDVMMRSVVENFNQKLVGVILTGMGRDGTEGALLIQQAGGPIVAEDESTCAVYGMPRSVVEAGAATYVAPLPEIASLIQRLLKGKLQDD